MFKYVLAERWKRIGPNAAGGAVQATPRPHLVPLTEGARRLVGLDACRNFTGLCPGEVLVDGAWALAYRFQELGPAAAAAVIEDLSEFVRQLAAAAMLPDPAEVVTPR